jgi:subtilase family serine protease
MRPYWLHHIFRHYFIQGTIFGEEVTEHRICVSIFSINLFETFLIVKIIQRDIVINVKTYSCKVSIIFVGFYLNLNFLYTFSKKDPNIKVKQNSSSGSHVITCGRTDGTTDMTKLFAFLRTRLKTLAQEHTHAEMVVALGVSILR